MIFLLDTNICIALLKKPDKALIRQFEAHAPHEMRLCAPVKAELLFGARYSQRVDDNLQLLEEFFAPFESLPFDDAAAEHCGMMRAILTRAGTPIGANDYLIASIALSHGAVVVTRNRREFERVPGLRVVNW